MKLKKSNSKIRHYILLMILAVCMAVVLLILIKQYTSKFQTTLNEETRTYMAEIAQQVTVVMNERVNNNLRNLQSDAVTIEAMGTKDPQSFYEYLQEEAERFGYTQISLVNAEGVSINNFGNTYNVSNRSHYLEALKGKPVVSEIISSGAGNPDCIEYAVPVYQNNQVVGVLMASYTLDTFHDILQVNMFDHKGSAMVVDSQGVVVVNQDDNKSYNFFQTLKKDPSVSKAEMKHFIADVSKGDSGVLDYTLDQINYMLYYHPLGINDWSILISVPNDVMTHKANMFLNGLIYISVAIALLIAVLMLIFVYMQYHNWKQLEKILYVDTITGGGTQAKFELEASKLIETHHSDSYVLVQMNLEKFKLINTTFGREAGNKTLNYIYTMLKRQLKEDELTARLSADKFGILLRFYSKEDLSSRLVTICADINSFNDDSKNKYILQFEMGIYFIHDKERPFELLLEHANFARKHGNKQKIGQTSLAFFDDVERNVILHEKEIENSMEQALKNGEFEMYLQPKYELEYHTIGGAEALVRWNSPEKGIIYPNDFIPLFEQNGFITKIDFYMFEQACKLQQRWKDTGAKAIPISVNMSRIHLNDPDFLDQYEEIFHRYDFPAGLIEIELTESTAFDNVERLCDIIKKMHKIGFTCSLDDFGSGYSSLNMLKDIPVDTLKLDRTFFYSHHADETKSRYVVENIVNLARKLNMQTVSEGIETLELVEYLHSVKCDMVQGYVFAKPMPVIQFEKLMQKEKKS